MSTVTRLLVYCRAECYPHGLFDYVLNMCCSYFVFRSRHSVCGRCLSIVPVHTNCCVLLGFVLRSGLRYALHPSHLPKLGYCRSAPVTWPCWCNIKAKPCLKRCRVPLMSTLCLSTNPCQCSLCSVLTPALPKPPTTADLSTGAWYVWCRRCPSILRETYWWVLYVCCSWNI